MPTALQSQPEVPTTPARSRKWWLVLACLPFLGVVLLILIGAASTPRPTSTSTPSPTPSIVAAQEAPAAATAPAVAGEAGETGQVVKVIDGDTIALADGRVIRYIGIDAPETSHPSRGRECFAAEATAKNRELVDGKTLRLERDVSETDRFDRPLRYVYVDTLFVNDALVREGYARAVTYPPDVKYADQFRAAEQEARAAGRGLWGSACAQAVPLAPAPSGGSARGSSTSAPGGPAPAPAPPPPSSVPPPPSAPVAGDRDCKDFATQEEAQAFFLSQGGPASDPHRLDKDGDGIACEGN